MKISIILAHPDKNSFNHAIASAVAAEAFKNGHGIIFHDLYAEGFDPVLPGKEIPSEAVLPQTVEKHCNEISSADGIVIVHPNWWGQPPAILTGWIDRVFRPGVAYNFLDNDSGEGVPAGLLKARSAIVFNTSNTPVDREQSVFGDPLELIWKKCIFELCGVTTFYREVFGVVVTSTFEQRRQWLDKVRSTVDHYFPAPDIKSDDFVNRGD
jgi:NAD(P)H dehydrogenase (quinone)